MTEPDAEALRAVRECGALQSWSEETLARVAARLRPRILRCGEIALAEGSPSDSMLLIAAGRLELIGRPDAVDGVGEFGPGALLGELGLLTGAPRTATVRAARESVVFALAEDDFIELVSVRESRPLIRQAQRRYTGERVRQARAELIAVTSPHPALRSEILPRLCATLSAQRRAHTATATRIVGADDLASALARCRALDALEATHEVLLVDADAAPADERDLWLRQADRVILLLAGGDDPAALRLPEGRGQRVALRFHAPPIHPVDSPQLPGLALFELRRGHDADLDRALGAYRDRHESLRGLRASALLGDLSDGDLRDALPLLEFTLLQGGEVLFQEGDPAESLYVVNTGRLEVFTRDRGGRERTINELGPGDALGDVALILGGRRTASVRALRDSELIEIRPEVYADLLERHPQIGRGLTRSLAEKLGQRHDATREARSIVLLSLDPELDLLDQARALAEAFGELGEVALITAGQIDRALGPGSSQLEPGAPGEAVVAQRLHRLESRHDYALYVAGPAPDAWTRRALRQADRVLLIARSEAPPAPGRMERELLGAAPITLAQRALLLVQPPGIEVASGTAAWLEGRALSIHLHVRREAPGDYARAARLLTHRGVGLALGGGGTRAMAHQGALQALWEREVPIDMVVGTSSGAVTSIGVAAGIPREEFYEISVGFSAVFDALWRSVTPPLTSFLTGARFSDEIAETMRGHRLEDLLVPARCVAVDLAAAELAVLDRGLAATAVRASTAIPLVFPPLIDGGRVLIDGGVLNNLPADLLLPWCGQGRVIASEISVDPSLSADCDYTDRLSGWRLLAGRWLPTLQPIRAPSLGAILESSLVLANQHHRRSLDGIIDLLFQPDVQGYSMTEVTTPEICERVYLQGYRHALGRLAGWSWRDPAP